MLKDNIFKGQEKIQQYLEGYFKNLQKQAKYYGQKRLCDAMQYSVLNGGKRFRALLVYWSGECIGLTDDILNPIAASLEIIHAFSLIHDDLPAMDDDDLRRSLPTCHIKFDEATAILAGDALCSEAFKLMASIKNIKNIKNIDHENIINAIEYFANAIGPNGMVAGQSMDVNNKDISDINSLNNLHNLKTGKLIQASILLPLILIGIDKTKSKLFEKMELYAKTLGVAFQIKDDLLDKTSSTQKLGKRAQKDSDMDKITYPEILGIEKCKSQLDKYTQDAINYINQAELLINNKNLDNLKLLATWNLEREN
jgi:farnesyl diphosphate synthase